MQLFYTPDILENPFLSEEESVHCVRVLRKTEGDKIDLTDGKGNFYKARIAESHPKHCCVELIETLPQPRHEGAIHVAIAPTKNLDRMEWMVEKLTEIGVDGIHFLNTRFSERKVLKTDRITKIAISAMKQSERATLPAIGELTQFKEFIQYGIPQGVDHRYICHCHNEEEAGTRLLLRDLTSKNDQSIVFIGPEGDFSIEEVKYAAEQGFKAVSLGDMRLRTETAGLVAALTLKMPGL